MGKRRNHTTPDIVRHPRYGAEPIPSGLTIPKDDILRGHWRYRGEAIYPESVLLADPSKQNYSIYPREYYVDILKRCRTCQRAFIFFAREQKYWFETLRFYVDADCVFCPVCRRETRTVRRRLRRYSDALAKPNKSRKELMFLVEDGVYLLRRGVLRDLHRLGQLKNQALKQIAEYPGTAQLADAIRNAPELAKDEL